MTRISPEKVRKVGNKADTVELILANSLANITDITNSLAIAGLFDADPRYEPLPSVFPRTQLATGTGRGEPPPWPPLGFVLVSFTLFTSKFTNVLDSFTSKFTNILE